MSMKLIIAQVIITIVALGLDLYGCFDLSLNPAIVSLVLGILDTITLFLYLKKKSRK